MASGLARIRSWPIVIAARPTASRGAGTLAATAGTPGASRSPSPKSRATRVRSRGSSRSASETNAVLQLFAKSSRNGTAPAAPPSKFRNDLPSTTSVAGQCTVSSGASPARSSAAVVTTLNVDPGG